jgi:pimeloyl-ACP methyl ester carboxylesterase
MCNKDDMRFLRSSLFSDYNTLIFDFRAHGDVKGDQPCTFGKNEIFDVIGAVHHIKSDPKLAKKPIIGYGFSMGAASIINAHAHASDLFDTVIVDCPFESIEGVIERGIEKLKFSLFGHEFSLPGRNMLRKYAYNAYAHYLLKMVLKSVAQVDTSHINTSIEVVSTEEAAQKLDIPALFIACENDEKTPLEAVRAVYDKVPGVKRLWMSDGRGHFDTFFSNPEEYKYRVNAFIKKVLDTRFIDKNTEKITDTRIIKKGEK